MDPNTRDREFRPLNKIKDNYPKYVLSMDEINLSSNGIIHMEYSWIFKGRWNINSTIFFLLN